MHKSQRFALVAAATLFLIACLFVPWIYESKGALREAGYGFLLSPPPSLGLMTARIDLGRFIAQLLAASGVGVAMFAGAGFIKFTDPAEAVKRLRHAADRGDARAQCALGKAYRKGKGVQRDLVQAYKWLILAAECNRIFREERDRFVLSMTPEQIAEAQRLSREWKPSQPSSPISPRQEEQAE